MKLFGIENKRQIRYLTIAALTLIAVALFHIFKPVEGSEGVENPEEVRFLGLYLIVALLILSGLLVYVSMGDFGKRSLVRIRIIRDDHNLRLTITNVTGRLQRFSEFEIQLEGRNKKTDCVTFHLNEELVIDNNKKWISKLDPIDLERRCKTDFKIREIRLKFTADNGINYFSNKLRLL